jgi:hypothetical protein
VAVISAVGGIFPSPALEGRGEGEKARRILLKATSMKMPFFKKVIEFIIKGGFSDPGFLHGRASHFTEDEGEKICL